MKDDRVFKDRRVTETIEFVSASGKMQIDGILDRGVDTIDLGRRSVDGESFVFLCSSEFAEYLAQGSLCIVRGQQRTVESVFDDNSGGLKVTFARIAY